jgi:arginyl-tRNA synthetase
MLTSLKKNLSQALSERYEVEISEQDIELVPTRAEFVGDWTWVAFPIAKQLGKNPVAIAESLGDYLLTHSSEVESFNVVKGYLNLVLDKKIWSNLLVSIAQNADFGFLPSSGRKVMIEFSSPNTNKPLHLGHLRNNFLGDSLSRILKAAGDEVMRVNLVNDRGVHICKSMLAYELHGNGEEPNENLKGDHLVGKYYVLFDKLYRAEVQELIQTYQLQTGDQDMDSLKERAEKESKLLKKVHDMLKDWESGDPKTLELWKKMNTWVLEGFEQTYRKTGISFDKYYYESNTYLLGKNIVEEGLSKGILYRKPDGSVWIDLQNDGLDQKLLLRSDGTSVYMTQDLGTADMKYADFPMDVSVYVVGNEQDYHFKVLSLILEKLQRPYSKGVYHLSYGMVDLPSGKMKSREGTVVDADDLLAEMIETSKQRTLELGKTDGFTAEKAENLYHSLALGALRYFLLKVDPKKRMLFNPEESVDFQGNTGVYIQYNHAKIAAILRKAELEGIKPDWEQLKTYESIEPAELELIITLSLYPSKLKEAAQEMSPALIANYVYGLAKSYSRFYSELPIFGDKNPLAIQFRILLSQQTARIIKTCLSLLGIEAPEKM